MARRLTGVDPEKYPAGTCFFYDIDLEEVEGFEVVLSEQFPEAFPKKRKRGNTRFAAGTSDGIAPQETEGPTLSIKSRAKQMARSAYDSTLESAKAMSRTTVKSAKERFWEHAAQEARKLALKARGPNNQPRKGWHRDATGFISPSGELIANLRDLYKYRDANIPRWKSNDYTLHEFNFEKESKVSPLDLETHLEALWSQADHETWLQAEAAEMQEIKDFDTNAHELARAAALDAAAAAGTRDPVAIVEGLFAPAVETKKKLAPQLITKPSTDTTSGQGSATAAPSHVRVVLPNEVSSVQEGRTATAVISAPVSSRGPMLIRSKLKRPSPPVPVKAPEPVQEIAPPPRKPQRYNVVERLEQLFAGGAIDDSEDDDSDLDDSAGSYYRDDDSFIDDSDMIALAEQRARSKRTLPTDFAGFFASADEINTREISPLRSAHRSHSKKKKKKTTDSSDPRIKKRRISLPGVDVSLMVARAAKIQFNQLNPKRGESAIRYEGYKAAQSVPEALDLGAFRADIKNDLLKGHLKLIPEPGQDEESLKRIYNLPSGRNAVEASPTVAASDRINSQSTKEINITSQPHLPASPLLNLGQESSLAQLGNIPSPQPTTIANGSSTAPIDSISQKKPKARKVSSPSSAKASTSIKTGTDVDIKKKSSSTNGAASPKRKSKPSEKPTSLAPKPKSMAKTAASSPKKPTAAKKKPAAAGISSESTRRVRCGECVGCKGVECGVCKFCLDKPKRGGENKLKRPCIARRCLTPRSVTIMSKNHSPLPRKVPSEPAVSDGRQEVPQERMNEALPPLAILVPPDEGLGNASERGEAFNFDDDFLSPSIANSIAPQQENNNLMDEVTAALADY